jgi:hypothetical protein
VNTVEVLVLSGSMGSGKTAVLKEASDLLTAADVSHAALDLDEVGIAHAPGASSAELPLRNLAALWNNYAALGIARLLLSEALDSEAKRAQLAGAIPGARIQVCRLRASLPTMQEGVRAREPGMLQERLVARVAELEASLDAAGIGDFEVQNEHRTVTEVAREVLMRAGWL